MRQWEIKTHAVSACGMPVVTGSAALPMCRAVPCRAVPCCAVLCCPGRIVSVGVVAKTVWRGAESEQRARLRGCTEDQVNTLGETVHKETDPSSAYRAAYSGQSCY